MRPRAEATGLTPTVVHVITCISIGERAMVVQKAKIRKLGNSQGILIPGEMLKALQLNVGQLVDIFIDVNALVIAKPAPELATLVKSVHKKMRLKEVSTGRAVGREGID